LACGVGTAKKLFEGFGVFEGWQTADLNAKNKLLISIDCRGYQGKKAFECLEGLMERTKFHFSGGPRSRPALANIRFDLLQFFC
jgi:hypothetical protein